MIMGFPIAKDKLAKSENLICATPNDEEQCVLLLSKQAQTHACQDAALTASLCQDWPYSTGSHK